MCEKATELESSEVCLTEKMMIFLSNEEIVRLCGFIVPNLAVFGDPIGDDHVRDETTRSRTL